MELDSWGIWTSRFDETAANRLKALTKLEYLKVDLTGVTGREPGAPVVSPALLAACRAHLAIETVDLGSSFWHPDFEEELQQALSRESKVDSVQEHFDSLAADTLAPKLLARALFRVRSKPYLRYLGVTCCLNLFL